MQILFLYRCRTEDVKTGLSKCKFLILKVGIGMRVAIIGAGLAGLSCAYQLKKYGITPDIFEKRSAVGNLLEHTICTLNIFDRTLMNPIKYLKKKYKLNIVPLSPLTEITMIAPNKKTIVKGRNLGYVFKRGYEKYSLEKQIESKLGLPISFNTYIKIDDIKDSYDRIIVATGDNSIAKDMGVWTTSYTFQVRVATVLGNFKKGSIKMWLNTGYAKNCYCYLLANNSKEACLVLALNSVSHQDLDYYWKEFLFDAEISYRITETRDTEYNTGYPDSAQVGNICFTGDSAGLMDDFLGFGAIRAIESGILAARAIAEGLDYSALVRPLQNDVKGIHEFRKALNTFDDRDFDRLVTFLGLPFVKQFIYKNPFFKAHCGIFAAKLYNSLKYKQRL